MKRKKKKKYNQLKFKFKITFTNLIGAIIAIYSVKNTFDIGCILGSILLLGRAGISLLEKYIETKYDYKAI